jgi:iron(III) transport system ATP-binding protein
VAKPHVELDRVGKRFGALVAVSDVSLVVPEGEFTTLLGPSGCGKTTLLRLVAGFLRPDTGEIRIRGERVNELPPQRRSTVIVFQDYALFPHLSVFENVAYGLRRRGLRGAELARRVREMLAFLHLESYETASPLTLSGGQQQRVALARALVVEPDVLLLDEPLSNLDAKLRVRVRTELKEIQQTLGKTTLLVTHDQEEALSVSDRVAVMEGGRLRQVGTPLDVYARPADGFVADFVGVANFLPATIRAVAADGVVLDSPLGPLRAEHRGAFAAGARVMVVLRPSSLHLSSTPGPGRLPAVLRTASFLGAVRRCDVVVGDRRLIVDVPLAEGTETAPELWLVVDPTQVHLLPAEAA